MIHERLIADGPVGILKSPLNHFSYPDIDTWLRKLKMFSLMRAEELARAGLKPSHFNFVRICLWRPATRFLRRFIFKLGFMDGVPGLLACVHDALTEILTYSILLDKERGQTPDEGG